MVAATRLTLVTAVCLIDDRMRVLVARRPPEKRHGGLWEFPGGKLEVGEPPEVGLCRELREELAIDVDPSSVHPVSFSTVAVDGLLMLLFSCREWEGTPTGAEGQQVEWVTAAQLRDGTRPMPPADVPLVRPVVQFIKDEFSCRWDRFGESC